MDFRRDSKVGEPQDDAELQQSIRDFRSSVSAWSESVYSQPHKPVRIYLTTGRVAARWALGCVLAMGSISGALYQRHHLNEQAKIAAATEAARQQKLEAERSIAGEDLLAKIDNDVSREVPSAMEPLARLMAEEDSDY